MTRTRQVLVFALLAAWVLRAEAQEAPPAGAQEPPRIQDQGWPRVYEAEGHEVVLHQPQVDGWDEFKLIRMRAAVVVRKKGFVESSVGAIKGSARTRVDHESRTVLLEARTFEEIRFPGEKPEKVKDLERIVRAALPDEQPIIIALDRVIAAVALGEQRKVRQAQVNLEPPVIHYSDAPAVLVVFAGKPRFKEVENTRLKFALNTNWDLFHDAGTSHYYLLNGDHWLVSKDLMEGDWIHAERLPAEMSRLPDHANWKDVRANVPAKKAFGQPAKVFVSTKPAELIVTQGPPLTEGIPGTNLAVVTNTDADVLLHATQRQYYFLAAGRWFRAESLKGPWSSATKDLPAEFASIPQESAAGEVLSSVPGTPQAEEAVIQASIPRRATVKRNEVTLEVTYDGKAKFVPIEGTKVQHAVNTSFSVFLVEERFYCCHQGIWFVAPAAEGPWSVAPSVPDAIYTIPASHPAHNVTYVFVYESTDDAVVVGTTAGYSGQYITSGVVVFGAGALTEEWVDDDDDYWYYWYPPYYFSYGCGAHYSYYDGTYFSGARVSYGPYGGAGAWAGYNPVTGVYSRGALRYGPSGTAYVRQAYNPWTGNYAARAGGSGAYGSWGRGVVTDGENWASGAYGSGSRGTAGGIRTSEGTGIAAGKVGSGPGTAVARDKEGDLYVARNGNVYKRDDDGGWHERENGQWSKAKDLPDSPRPRTEAPGTLRDAQSPAPRPAQRPNFTAPNYDLNTQAFSRDRGSYSSGQAAQRATPSGSRGGGGTRGGGRR